MSSLPTSKEFEIAKSWFEDSFSLPSKEAMLFPVRFNYQGKDSADFLQSWGRQDKVIIDDSFRLEKEITLTDPATGLELRIEATLFKDFPAVEWLAHFKNTGKEDTPPVSEIQVLNAIFAIGKEPPHIHHSRGSNCKIDDFELLDERLQWWDEFTLASVNGRSSDVTFPFFNMENEGAGVIGAIGWTGNWKASFSRKVENQVAVHAGMQKTNIKLLPGEEIRSPRMLLIFWEGDFNHSQNMLRKFILAHHTPTVNGQPLKAPTCDAVWGENYTDNQIAKAQWWKKNNIPMDCFWIDAGWHGDAPFLEGSTVFNSQWATQVGNWWPNRITYPDGLKPIGDVVAAEGMGFVLWLEVERALKGTKFTVDHPEWLLGPEGDNFLYNLGIPEACEALIELVSSIIQEGKVTCYRQDFNMPADVFWNKADAEDRVGISEIRHIEGLYKFWDGLLERNPGLFIDNCSSGGRRIDLETISRSIPLWRSDYQCFPNFEPTGMQGQTHGLGTWIPLSTGCSDRVDTYAFRSAMGPGLISTIAIWEKSALGDDFAVDWQRDMLNQENLVREYFYGDFYPLLSFSLAEDAWAAWQYNRTDLGEGCILAFRREKSPFAAMTTPLYDLESGATYEIRDIDTGEVTKTSADDLIAGNMTIEIPEKRSAKILIYKKIS